MTLYSYIVRYDDGFAPNPFHGVCTLACCKRVIRDVAKEGDYIIGLGSRHLGNRVVYAMRVSEILTFEDYWHDRRFRDKRPDMKAGGIEALGDNIYHWDVAKGEWHKDFSLHSREDLDEDRWLTEDDTGRTDNVLIGEDFIYWGGDGPSLPDDLTDLIVGRGHKCNFSPEVIRAFTKWFKGKKRRGRLGMPTNELPSPATEMPACKQC